MRSVWTVIRREYLQRVRSKWFVLTTVGAPIFLLGIVLVPFFLGEREAEVRSRLALVDRTGALHERVAPRLENAGFTVERVEPALGVEDALRDRVAEGELGGFLVLDEATLQRGVSVFTGESGPSALRRFGIQQSVAQSVLEYRLGGSASAPPVDVESLLSGGELEVRLLDPDRADEDRYTAFMIAFAGSFLLYFVILFYSVAVLRAVMEEKTGRIVEVIISSLRPWQLMLGKILGVGAVGLTQLAVWVLIALLVSSLALPYMVALLPGGLDLAEMRRFLPGLGLLALFVVFFVLGHFLYAGLFAAVGAMCSTEEEAQQAQFPVVMLLVVPVIFAGAVIQNPEAASSVALSLVPFFSPILMFARVAAGGAPVWQVILSLLGMVAAIGGVAWIAGRIYRVGILMQGKRPTLPELVRWVREA